MRARLTPAPRSEALGAVQMRRAGDAEDDAEAAPKYTTAAPAGTSQINCPHLVTWLGYQQLVTVQEGAYDR